MTKEEFIKLVDSVKNNALSKTNFTNDCQINGAYYNLANSCHSLLISLNEIEIKDELFKIETNDTDAT